MVQVDDSDEEQPTGWVECSRGLIHRAEQRDCIYPSSLAGSCSSGGGTCSADADCDAQPHGYCNDVGGFGDVGCACNYGCERDDDCGPDQACFCLGASSRCVTAHCRTNADCADGHLCAMLGDEVLACHGPEDTCRTDRDCNDGSCPACKYAEPDAAWQCVPDGGHCDTGG